MRRFQIGIDRRFFEAFDWILVGLTLLISLAGVFTIYSATRPVGNLPHSIFYLKQLVWIGISLTAMLALLTVDYRWFQRMAYPLFALGLGMLVLVLVLGRIGMGAQRWLSLGFFSFQPSEVAKLLFIVALARVLAEHGPPMGMGRILRLSVVFLLPPLILLLLQPDLGTGLMFAFIFFAMLIVAGIQRRVLVALTLVAVLGVPFLGNVFWSGLKVYQKNRILAFVRPEADPSGIGYQIRPLVFTLVGTP